MSEEIQLNALYDRNLPFRLYAEHRNGLSVSELASLAARPAYWIAEQIEASRLCVEHQVQFDLHPFARVCSDDVWQQQIWD